MRTCSRRCAPCGSPLVALPGGGDNASAASSPSPLAILPDGSRHPRPGRTPLDGRRSPSGSAPTLALSRAHHRLPTRRPAQPASRGAPTPDARGGPTPGIGAVGARATGGRASLQHFFLDAALDKPGKCRYNTPLSSALRLLTRASFHSIIALQLGGWEAPT